MKEFNGIVRVGDDSNLMEAVEMPFSEVLKLPSFRGEGRGRKPIYNFICFTFGVNDYNYYEKGFIKICLESWKKRFPLSRYIFINVEDCFEVSLWSKFLCSKKLRSFATDSLRLYFTSLLDNCFYFDTDIYVLDDAKFPLKENEFIIDNTSGQGIWNKKRNNKRIKEWFNLYEDKILRIALDASFEKICTLSDVLIYGDYVEDKIKSISDKGLVVNLGVVTYTIVDKAILIIARPENDNACTCKIANGKHANWHPYFMIDNNIFWGCVSIIIEKWVASIFKSDKFYINTNSNRFYVKVENGVPIEISFKKREGYRISYSNRLFISWAKYYFSNGLYKNIKFVDDDIAIGRIFEQW
jgi:hypothetical protein